MSGVECEGKGEDIEGVRVSGVESEGKGEYIEGVRDRVGLKVRGREER